MDFLADKYRIVSGADDYTSKVWDVASSSELVSYQEHMDYVRCGCASKLNADLFVTGWWFAFLLICVKVVSYLIFIVWFWMPL